MCVNNQKNNGGLVEYHLNNYYYNRKPTSNEAGIITNVILQSKQKSTSIQELANHLVKGKTVMLGVMPDYLRRCNPVNELVAYQHLFFVDIDNSKGNFLTLKQALNHQFIKGNACFIYNTFSNDEAEVDKFRIVFKSNVNLTNHLQVQEMYQYLFSKLPSGAFDTHTVNASRLFFGGRNLTVINYNNVVNVPPHILNIKVNEDDIAKIKKDALINKEVKSGRIPNSAVDSQTPTYFLLKNNEYSLDPVVKAKWNLPAKSFNSIIEFCNYFNSLNTFNLLGIKPSTSFHCILSRDSKPSASVFKSNKDGNYIYKRFSSDSSKQYVFNNIQLMEKLFRLNFMQTICKLLYLSNCRIVSNNSSPIINNLNNFINLLHSPTLMQDYPSIYKIYSKYIQEITYILNLLSHSVEEGQIISVFSNKFLSKMVYGSINKQKKINKLINLLVFTQVLNKPNKIDLPPSILEFTQITKYQNHVTVLSFSHLIKDVISIVNQRCSLLTANNITANDINRDTIIRISNIEVANSVFNQNTSNSLTTLSKEIESYVTSLVLSTVESDKYITVAAVNSAIKSQFNISLNTSKKYLKGILVNLLAAYNLQSVCLNNSLKKEFNVTNLYSPSQFPKVICKRN